MFRAQRMDFLLRISLHAVVLCGLVTVILTGEIPVPIWLLALGAHLLSIFVRPKKGGVLFNVIVILGFVYSIFLYFFLDAPFLIAFTQLLIVAQALKLFHLEKVKDHFQLAGLSLLMLLAAAGLTSHIYYLGFFFLFLLLGSWFLYLLHLKGDLERYPQVSSPPRELTSFSVFLGIFGVAFCSFFVTIVLFFALPRLSLSVIGKEKSGGPPLGLSALVDLADAGPITLNNRVVMRVELPQFEQQPAFPLYWRGMTFAVWDGRTWKKGDSSKKTVKRGWRRGVILRRGTNSRHVIYQRILIEPMGTDLLFCLHPALEVRGDFPYLNVEEGGGLHLPSPPLGRYQYEVYSSLQPWEAGLEEPPEKINDFYLELPEGSAYIAKLAQEIVQGEKSPLTKIQRVISYLRNNGKYSLNPKRNSALPPMEDFLLESREGYCEHFATAAALLLRGVGVPTRLVGGFLRGEWNPLGGYFMVRQRDAHAWIEAHLPGIGWLAFDPTPAGAEADPPAFLSTLYRYLDFLKLKWNRYIVQYSHKDQLRILFAFRRGLTDLRLFQDFLLLEHVKRRTSSQLRPYLVLAGMASLTTVLLIFWGLKRRKRLIRANVVGKAPAEIKFYLKLLGVFGRKRIPKGTSETPAEFAQRVGQRWGELYPTINRITHLYYRVRFGQISLTPQEHEEIRKTIGDLKGKISSLSFPAGS